MAFLPSAHDGLTVRRSPRKVEPAFNLSSKYPLTLPLSPKRLGERIPQPALGFVGIAPGDEDHLSLATPNGNHRPPVRDAQLAPGVRRRLVGQGEFAVDHPHLN